MRILEHVPARVRADRYRDRDAATGGSLVAIVPRADASRWQAAVLAAAAAISAGAVVGTISLGLFLPLHLTVLAPASVVLTVAALRATSRALSRARIEVRGTRIAARTIGLPPRQVVLESADVRVLDVLEVARPRSGGDEVALVARLADESIVVLIEPLTLADATSLRDLASSALGIDRSTR